MNYQVVLVEPQVDKLATVWSLHVQLQNEIWNLEYVFHSVESISLLVMILTLILHC